MHTEDIVQRIQLLKKGQVVLQPVRVYYSGPATSEAAIYYGDHTNFKDCIDFWISFISWVKMDSIEFDDISTLNESKVYPPEFIYCIKNDPESKDLQAITDMVKSLPHFSVEMKIKECYQMGDQWEDVRYLFDCGDAFFLFNKYTGE